MVFLGGAVVDALLTDPAAPPQRTTKDIDVVLLKPMSTVEYYQVEDRLRELGFNQDPGETKFCRWHHSHFVLDITPPNDAVGGAVNRWYTSACEHAEQLDLTDGTSIRVINAPHFIGTKLVAFEARGSSDPYSSHDLEDIVAVINGRESIVDEIANSPIELRDYISSTMRHIVEQSNAREIIEGHLGMTESLDGRLETVLIRIESIVALPG